MLESVLFPIVSKINEYLSSYILIFLLVGVGLWYSIKTRFVQVRCFGEGMKKFFGEMNLRGGAQKSGMTSFQALATAIAAQVGTGNIVPRLPWPRRPVSLSLTAISRAARSITSPPRSRADSANSWRDSSLSPSS